MAEIGKPTIGHVAGFVKKGSLNKDGSVTFKVAGQRFIVNQKIDFAAALSTAKRALVRFESVGKNPRILLVIPDPTVRVIRQYMHE